MHAQCYVHPELFTMRQLVEVGRGAPPQGCDDEHCMQVHGLPPGLGQVIAANGSVNHDGGGLKSPRSGAAAANDAISAKQQPDGDKPEQVHQSVTQIRITVRRLSPGVSKVFSRRGAWTPPGCDCTWTKMRP